MPEKLKVDIWSDVVCPWCYIGKRKFEAGVSAFMSATDPAPALEVEFHSFQLSPDMPVDFDGTAADFLVRHKGISEAHARQLQDHVAGIAAGVALDYDFEALRPANTLKAHQVLHLAKTRGLQVEMKERLLAAHFLEGRHVGRDDELADLAGEVGLNRDEVKKSLDLEEFLTAVHQDQQLAARLGIRGVPFFVVDGRYGVSGAQSPEVFTEVLARTTTKQEESAIGGHG